MASFPGVDIQLASVGPQDTYIRSTECSSKEDVFAPFRGFHVKRCTSGTFEDTEIPFDTFAFGKLNVMNIPRSGDLLGNLTLEIRLPVVPGASSSDAWVDRIGHVLLKRVRIKIDDVVVHDFERLWMDISDTLFLAAGHGTGMEEMLGKNHLSLAKSHVIYVPLKTFSSKSHHARQNFMPLLSTPGSSMIIEIDTETFQNCVAAFSGGVHQELLDIKVNLLAQFVFLDHSEKERVINRTHDILIEAVQDVEAVSYVDSGDGMRTPLDTVRLNLSELNFPVKALFWVAYDTSDLSNKRYFEYSDQIASSILFLDGVERYSVADEGTTNLVESYYRGRRCVADHLHAYSFSLDYSSWQPAGQLSFSEVKRPVLQINLKRKTPNLVVKVFALGYKFLVFEKGRVRSLFT